MSTEPKGKANWVSVAKKEAGKVGALLRTILLYYYENEIDYAHCYRCKIQALPEIVFDLYV